MIRFLMLTTSFLFSASALAIYCPGEGGFQIDGANYSYSNCEDQPEAFKYTNQPGHPCDSIVLQIQCDVVLPDGRHTRGTLTNVLPAQNTQPGPSCGQQASFNYPASCYMQQSASGVHSTFEQFCSGFALKQAAGEGAVDLNNSPTFRSHVFEMAPGRDTQ